MVYLALMLYVIGCIAAELRVSINHRDVPLWRILLWPWGVIVAIAHYLGALWIVLKANRRDI